MLYIVDTNALLGWIAPQDRWHKPAQVNRDSILRNRHEIILPRIVVIETFGHAARSLAGNRPKAENKNESSKILESIYSFTSQIIEHETTDYPAAEKLWQRYSDWPIEFPDALIVVTAMRVRAQYLWTYDRALTRLIHQEQIEIQISGLIGEG